MAEPARRIEKSTIRTRRAVSDKRILRSFQYFDALFSLHCEKNLSPELAKRMRELLNGLQTRLKTRV